MFALALFVLAILLLYALWAFNPLSGITGFVKISTTAYAFTKWSLEMRAVIVKANNFTSSYQQVVSGLVSASLTLEADTYDQGNMPFTVGTSYIFILGYTVGVSVTVTIVLESITPTVDVEGGQPIKITGQSNGSFTAAIA